MARDADDDYYYEEGTVNEIMDEWAIYEKNGQVSLHHKANDNQVRFSDLAYVFEAERGAPDSDELADGEKMLYVADGSAANSAAGDVVIARNNGGTIEEAVVSLTFAAV